jgi:ubiquinone/menaquinone biosynthesis C-methylase UbiE
MSGATQDPVGSAGSHSSRFPPRAANPCDLTGSACTRQVTCSAVRFPCADASIIAPMDQEPAAIVEAGYDAMAGQYLEYMEAAGKDPRLRFLDELQHRLADGSDVVDLGCGAGVPCTRLLAERHSVLGVDVSAAQLSLATMNVPTARFVKADFSDLELPAASIDAVTAFYSMTHVPRDRHRDTFGRIARWLRPGGYLLLTLSASGGSHGVQDDFCGVPMYFSGFAPDMNRQLLRAASLDIVLDEIVPTADAESSTFQWVLARVPGSTTPPV